MKVLLIAINAKYIHSNLAVYDLKAYCQRYGEQIQLAEYTINQHSDDILMDIYRKSPQILAFSCYIWNIGMVKELGHDLKKILPDVPIWLGGPEVSYESEAFLQEQPWADGIMAGEGEKTFLELMEYYQEKKGRLSAIRGLIYRQNGQVCANPPRSVMNLDEVPFVYDRPERFEHKIMYYESSRGCPFSCSYCLSSIDKKVRFRKLELVKKELQCFLDAKVPQVKFVDRTFNCSRDHALGIWNYIREHDNGITNFHFEIGADLLDEEELQVLEQMRPGLVQLEIGVQTANPDTIHAIFRKMDLKRIEQAVARIHKNGNIHQHLDLIAGLPFEDIESFQVSFNRVYAMKPHQLQLGFLKVLKGSYMYEHAGEYGLVYKEIEPYEVLCTRWMSYEDVVRLKAVEKMVELYYNSMQFRYTLSWFVPKWESAFSFFSALAVWYEKKTPSMQSHSRLAAYQMLLQFLEERHPQEQKRARELLTMDLYAREKVKSRPQWAAAQDDYKEQFRSFYKKEEQNRRFLAHYEGILAKQLANMTHIEVFTQISEEKKVLLYDYRRRNPVTKEAAMTEIVLERV